MQCYQMHNTRILQKLCYLAQKRNRLSIGGYTCSQLVRGVCPHAKAHQTLYIKNMHVPIKRGTQTLFAYDCVAKAYVWVDLASLIGDCERELVQGDVLVPILYY